MVFGSKKSVPFNPEKDIPSLDGKVILVTGGNIGLGEQSILEFSRHSPAQIWLAARSLEKAQAAADKIRKQVPNAPIKLLELDLASLASVSKAATTFSSQSDRLDILMLNAGIMAAPAGLTKDSYELQFGTNHMGHALLTKLLLPVLKRTAQRSDSDVRVVSLSSGGHALAPSGGIMFDVLKTPANGLNAYTRYGQSKLANVLFARQLAKECPELTVSAVHPGLVQTNLQAGATGAGVLGAVMGRVVSLFKIPVEEGALNQLWASVAKEVKSGEYYVPVGIGGSASSNGKDDKLAKKLWDWTARELEKF
jgi:retinol dehydrogenase-12